jgi:nucleotide-binding universal stress UspA family protein
MSAASNMRFEPAAELSGSLSARMLRLWCAPETILAATNLADEETLLFHAIRQARPSSAKVILVHVLENQRLSFRPATRPVSAGPVHSSELAQQTLERMARQLRWVGIPCEPLLLKGEPAEEVLAVAKARGVNRLLLSVESVGRPRTRTLAEEISPWAGVPVCVVRERLLPGTKNDRPAGQITLALSLRSNSETLLRFAGRLAQELDASLTVMHVAESGHDDASAMEGTPAALTSRFVSESLREAQLLCPLEIAVCTGDPAMEILKYVAGTSHDYLIVGAPQSPCADRPESASAVHKIVREARCPVIILGPSALHRRSLEPLTAAPVPFS